MVSPFAELTWAREGHSRVGLPYGLRNLPSSEPNTRAAPYVLLYGTSNASCVWPGQLLPSHVESETFRLLSFATSSDTLAPCSLDASKQLLATRVPANPW